jgi:hypothetical protein
MNDFRQSSMDVRRTNYDDNSNDHSVETADRTISTNRLLPVDYAILTNPLTTCLVHLEVARSQYFNIAMSNSGAGVASSSRPHGSGSISSSPDPRSKAIDLSPLKELVKDSLLETLIGIPGGKTLVLDKDLSGSLGLIVDVGSLKVGSNLPFDQEDGMLSRLHPHFKCWPHFAYSESSSREDVLAGVWASAGTHPEYRLSYST